MTRQLTAITVILAAALPAAAQPYPTVEKGPEQQAFEQLIIFVQPHVSDLSWHFYGEELRPIAQLAAGMGLQLVVIDASKSAPTEVGITPLIVYQNYRGRSIYQGRYNTLDRLRSFIRTARVLPQEDKPLVRTDTAVWRQGRAQVVTPIKITELWGNMPMPFNQEQFVAQMRQAAIEGYEQFRGAERVELGRSDRMFYVDFYPSRRDDGTLAVGVGIYSQFHCHAPVFWHVDDPITGPWSNRKEVFAKAAKLAELKIAMLLGELEDGDGFDPVGEDVPVVTWASLNLDLPPKPDDAPAVDAAGLELSQRWVVEQAVVGDQPPVYFRFPAPLELYSGSSTEMTGQVTLGDDLDLSGATGRFVVPARSVTMGEPDLDKVIHGPTILKAEQFPDASFEFDRIDTDGDIAFGQVTPGMLVGRFTMKGQTIDLSVPVTIEAVVGADGKPRLVFDGRWDIRLTQPFEIEGPDGPEIERDTLIYVCHIVLAPAEQ